MTTLHHHAALNRALEETKTRLQALGAPAPLTQKGNAADQVLARQEHEGQLLDRARLERLRDRIEHAIVRIARGSYGRCVDCAGPIQAKRLDATPWAERCVPCEAAAERHEGTVPLDEGYA